jgi:hypothetical protein
MFSGFLKKKIPKTAKSSGSGKFGSTTLPYRDAQNIERSQGKRPIVVFME